MIVQSDSLEFLKSIKDYENDIIYADPPYALGSEIIVRPDGKIDYKKASDFMNKWEMPTGDYWSAWFKEAYRTLKHGGYLLMFGMDRQLLLFKYYAHLAGFQEQQSIYWYYISNFPKSTDLSKMIDKNAGAEREVIGKSNRHGGGIKGNETSYRVPEEIPNITKPSTDLAKKYEGYKYSISPLKQTCETIMVFKKPNKTGSVLHDTLAYENGDDTITCSALNIDGNRVGTDKINIHDAPVGTFAGGEPNRGSDTESYREVEGRYPAQTFINSQIAKRLDEQSGISKSQTAIKINSGGKNFGSDTPKPSSENIGYNDTGGCSKILHKCDYEQIDFDLFIYQPKVSKKERNAGLDTFEDLKFNSDVPIPQRAERPFNSIKNNHPTLKPLSLNEKVLRLFKTPNSQRICYPFAGAGSEIIGGIKAGFDNWTACELNQDYIDIANARIEYWTKQKNMVNDIKSTSKVNEVFEKGQVNLFGILNEQKQETEQENLFNQK